MKFRLSDDILRAIAALVSVAAAASSFLLNESPMTFILALVLIFFLPGYALTRLLFLRELKMDMLLLYSIGLSVLTSILVALVLAVTIRLTQESALVALLGITIGALILDRIRHPENRKIEVEILRPEKKDLDPVIVTALAFGIIVSAVFGYMILTAEKPSRTHVILMSADGDDQLPVNGSLGEQIDFQIELMNGEGEIADFRLEVLVNESDTEFLLNGEIVNSYSTSLENMEEELLDISVTPAITGELKIMVEIYINESYYNEVHFWVTII